MARDFHIHARLKEEMERFELDKGVVIVRFKKVGMRDIVLHRSWMVDG